MILNILSIVLFFVFLTLGIIHFHWVFGGKWGLKNAIPTKKESENLNFRPSNFATLIVAIALISFALLYLMLSELTSFKLPKWTNYLLWVLPSIFLLRAIGEFKYVGFFKSVKSTLFAKWDSKLFSPLCLFISVLGFTIVILY